MTFDIDELRKSLLALDDDLEALAVLGDIETLASHVSRLQEIHRDLGGELYEARVRLAELIVDDCNERGETGAPKYHHPDLGVIGLTSGITRSDWDSDELLRLVIQDGAITSDGEVLSTPADLVASLSESIGMVLTITPSTRWKVTGLRQMGLEPANYCVEGEAIRQAEVP